MEVLCRGAALRVGDGFDALAVGLLEGGAGHAGVLLKCFYWLQPAYLLL